MMNILLDINQIGFVITEKGSVYMYLKDGRTQRFKTIEGQLQDPQDLLVFIPNHKRILEIAPKELVNSNLFGRTEEEYQEVLISAMVRALVVDKKGKKLRTNQDIQSAGNPIFLAAPDYIYKIKEQAFSLPVSHIPMLEFYAFDMSYINSGENRTVIRHLGNRVSQIFLKDGRVIY